MNRTNDFMMKRMKKSLALMLLAMVLLLSACGQKPVFGVSTNEDNSISITADRGFKDSMGLGYLTVGENEQVVIDATGMDKDRKLTLRFMVGVLGSDEFPEEPAYETSVSGGDSAVYPVEPGEYTVGVIAQSKITGTARICTKAADGTAASAAPSEAASAAAAESDLALQPGEHFEGTVPLEGTEQTVHYEAIRNDTLGFEMGYDYENFVRQSEADCERFISVWDNPDNPEIYLEITHSSDDAEATAASIAETLSAQYNVSRWEYTLDHALATASISGASWIKRGRCPSGSFRWFILSLLTTAVSSPGGITHRKAPRAAHEPFSRIRGWRSVLSSANIDLSDRDLASVFEIKYAVLLYLVYFMILPRERKLLAFAFLW